MKAMETIIFVETTVLTLVAGAIAYFWKNKVSQQVCNLKHNELDRRLDIIVNDIKNDIKELKQAHQNLMNTVNEIKDYLINKKH